MMRHAYLKNNDSSNAGGSRGGVSCIDGDWELEIGENQYASVEMLALCAYIDEITEFFDSCTSSPIARMIYQGIKAEQKRLEESKPIDISL